MAQHSSHRALLHGHRHQSLNTTIRISQYVMKRVVNARNLTDFSDDCHRKYNTLKYKQISHLCWCRRTYTVEATTRTTISSYMILNGGWGMLPLLLLQDNETLFTETPGQPSDHSRLSLYEGWKFGCSNKQRITWNTTDLFRRQFSGSQRALKRASFGSLLWPFFADRKSLALQQYLS